jgi:hypothetical protein
MRRLARLCLPFCVFAALLAFEAYACTQSDAQTGLPNPAPLPANAASIHGTVKSTDGTDYEAARVELELGGGPPTFQETDDEGTFTFKNLPAGTFELVVSSNGFETQKVAGVLDTGQALEINTITLPVANAATEIRVSAESQEELAQEQVNVEEKQRVLGVIPNYYVSYDRDPLPLTTRQKFQLAWKTEIDPVSFALAGAIAGVEQAHNALSGYGQGAQGYGKRFGANYADGFVGTMVGNAILPSWFKQDPRYFYKGTGSVVSRAAYAIANSVICKGDNARWQPNYSAIIGGLAAGGIANLYYPASSRSGVTVSFENLGIGTAGTGVQNLFQEFLVRKFTPRLRRTSSSNSH